MNANTPPMARPPAVFALFRTIDHHPDVGSTGVEPTLPGRAGEDDYSLTQRLPWAVLNRPTTLTVLPQTFTGTLTGT